MDLEASGRVASLFPEMSGQPAIDFQQVCRWSQYVSASVQNHPDIVGDLAASGDLERQYPPGSLYRNIRKKLELAESVDHFDRLLRIIRRREMVRIIFRDFSHRADLRQTMMDLSDLADGCIAGTVEFHYQENCRRSGIPVSPDGRAQKMCVLALGKLGARELNLSSDVDLIFLYDEQGEARSKTGETISNQAFFLRMSRQIIASLHEMTADGFVFRVDMRLRPYGESGALILHRAAMEKYFLEQGRDWERYAFIKARAVAGDRKLGDEFLGWLTPFVYRRHLDYGAVESLRDMKRLIDRQVELKELHEDIKLGPGGIREIEFIVQAHQLIHGGNVPSLRRRNLLEVLHHLGEERYLPQEVTEVLGKAYVFLRNSEHAIQGRDDRQTQMLPEEESARQALAEITGFPGWAEYRTALDEHRERVSRIFSSFLSANQAETEHLVEGNVQWQVVWREPGSAGSIDLLRRAGFAEAGQAAEKLGSLRNRTIGLQEIGRERVDKLMPVLLRLVEGQQSADVTLERVVPIVEAVTRRSTYLAFLLENADALKRMVDLSAMSSFVATQLAQYPILLYELTGRKTHEASFDKTVLEEELRKAMEVIAKDDLEEQMDTLRRFRNAVVFRVAVSELLDLVTVMEASDALTVTAEVVLQEVYRLAWRQLVEKHGKPPGPDPDREGHGGGFAVIAYGKLGGIELAYGSDLDLVFIADTGVHGMTDGQSPINSNVFLSRLSRRIIHILTMMTRFGVLYQVDMRLRPSGNKGPMVSTLTAFERYQMENAWTWEHQALVRARYVAGDPDTGAGFSRIREKILTRQRDGDSLRASVGDMRRKMREHGGGWRQHEADGEGDTMRPGFDLKHEFGAIVDIEFMVQYAVLAWAHDHPRLALWTDKMRLLDELRAAGLVRDADVELLQQAWLAYRSVVHYQWLGGELESFDQLQKYRQAVVSIWRRYMEPDPVSG